ncbi:hypothetical protein LJR118_004066 [Acidovorax sp. LjRoot118]|uniref:hypothetical protein n=1 Tax=Acidovorax sp. LjRoot118 TaxID=3342256 RepID=UPI003ECEE249
MTQPSLDTSRLDVLIHLDQGDSTKALPTNQLVQVRHYQSLRQQITSHLDSLSSTAERPNRYPFGSGWTQFIDGSRGAGKSTFLSSVKQALDSDDEIKGRIVFFDVIDPSRIEDGEIPLLVILQALRKHVDSAIKGNRRLDDDLVRDEWRQAFRGVAGGLSLFAKDFHPLNDLDPEIFLDWGLERASDSIKLREGLHRLFDLACRILGVKALILGFDDADTDSTLAVPLLECIRKYLDTPRVMVLVTGDLELYSLLMRQRFGKTVAGRPEAALDLQRRSAQGDRSAQYLRMIDHLEEQYLLKLFPIRRRMHLQPLWNVMSHDKCQVTHQIWDAQFSVKEMVGALVNHGLRVKTQSDIALYTEFLLKQPLRSVLQVMERCAPHLGNLKSKKLDSLNWSPELTRELSRSLQALALTSLYKHSIDTDAIGAGELPALTQAVFDLSLQEGDLDTAPYLRPMSGDQSIKACFAALAGEVPNFCAQKPGTALRYLLRGPGSVSLYSLAKPDLIAGDSSRSLEPDARFTSYMGVGRGEDSLDWARRATAVIALPYSKNYKGSVVLPGVVGLRGSTKGRTGELAASTVIKKIAAPNQPLPVFALGMLKVVSDTSSRTYGSIFAILGLAEKLISGSHQNDDTAHTVFARAYPMLTVSAPSWSLKGSTEVEVDESENDSDDSENIQKSRELLWGKVKKWLGDVNDLSETTLPSAIFLGKVWTRIYFSLHNAAHELKSAKFGTLMEIFSLCIINAFLVEEAEHHMPRSSVSPVDAWRIDRNNPRKSAKSFIDKMNAVKPQRQDFPFTAMMATCPLLLGLLEKEKGYANALKPMFPKGVLIGEIEGLLCSARVFNLIEKVSIPGEASTVGRRTSRSNSTNAGVSDSGPGTES